MPVNTRAPLFFLALALLTGAGLLLRPAEAGERDAKLPERSPLPALLDAIGREYPLPVEPNRLEDASLDAMLHGLDPHSNYYDPPTYARMNEDQEGHFSGVGLLVNKRKGEPVMIIAPVRDSPGFTAGILAGDTIAAIDGASTLPLDGDAVVEKLRGDSGTLVKLLMNRAGREKPVEVTLKRTEIPKSSLTVAAADRSVAVARISSFAGSSAQDIRAAVDRLGGARLRGMVLDLRGNPGGRLNTAIDLACLFLRQGQPVLEVRGRRPESRELQRCRADGPYLKLPLIVLIDHESASASEVVSGALQDHDRAFVVGEPSWGKGLVQTVYPLTDWHAGLALTTAKYYTPSGRLIQKSFGTSYDEYYLDETGAGSDTKDYPTDRGRTVKGGGGITPDFVLKAGTVDGVNEWLEKDRRLFRFALPRMDLAAGASWTASPSDLAALHDFLRREGAALDEKKWAAQQPYLRAALAREVRLVSAFPLESAAAMLPWDPVYNGARDKFPEAEALVRAFVGPPPAAAPEKKPAA